MAEVILPGTYIKVHDEGLISAGAVSSGNIGIVGTASKGPLNEVVILSSFSEARDVFGETGNWNSQSQDNLSLIRSLEQIFNNGGKTVYAVRVGTSLAATASLVLKKGTKKFLTLSAKTKGTAGNETSAELTLSPDGNQLVLLSGQTEEIYDITTITKLASDINNISQLVIASSASEEVPDAIAETKLAGGLDGEALTSAELKIGLELLERDIINIVVMAGKTSSDASLLAAHLKKTAGNKRERIAVVGASSDTVASIAAHNVNSDRMVLVAPGIKSKTIVPQTRQEVTVDLPASYTAAAIAGLLASVPVQTSVTNKVLAISGLSDVYNTGELEKLVQSRTLSVEQREGYRVVKGITTATNSAWHQITTRRIVDYAIYGVRSGCNPYIGKLNNERVRNAMKATLDAFLTRMVNNESLISYELNVSATRAEQIEGVVQVSMTLRPTFSIDFIKVNMYLG